MWLCFVESSFQVHDFGNLLLKYVMFEIECVQWYVTCLDMYYFLLFLRNMDSKNCIGMENIIHHRVQTNMLFWKIEQL